MRLSLLAIAATAVSAYSHEWKAPGPDDFRGPCPMMNTLANHAFLPHDGRGITKDAAIKALGEGLNFNATLAGIMWQQAIIANPEPNATFFTLDHLNRHNVLEHDASLTRTDAYFGSNHIFNETVFEESRAYFTDPIITAKMFANAKLARQITSRAFNPDYTFSEHTEAFSLGEIAAPFIAFGDMENVLVNRTLVEFWLLNEKLPFELGWSQKEEEITLEDITSVSEAMGAATNLFTGAEKSASIARRYYDLHFPRSE